VTIRVTAPPDDRAGRLSLRGQSFDLLSDDLHPAEIELATANFDFEIDNATTISDLLDQVRRVARALGL
jgi:dephospho-CoA kinase